MKKTLNLFMIILWLAAAFPAMSSVLSPEQQANHVLNRLAYGPRPGDIEQVTRMGIRNYIESQLDPASIPLPPALVQRLRSLDVTEQRAGDTLADFLSVRNAPRDDDDAGKKKRRDVIGRITEQTAEARIARAIDSPRQLEEVMVDFWFNHFNVFSGKGLDRALVGSYERDAIRPYVLGSFRDLLGATARHPAMLFYLDNWLSTSADYQPRAMNARFGQGPKAKANGLNENYARELMELHTLGVDGGYTQKDVTELARMLTGWTFDPRDLARSNRAFRFDAERHDQGGKQWLGRYLAPQGEREGDMALNILAMHPATAHHISYKLAQYFVQDQPPPKLVERLTQRYLDTKGDIRSVLRTLFFSPEFMAETTVGNKFKTPYQFVISAARASALPIANIRPLLGALNQLGMPLYGCQTPDGYRNTEAAWLNSDALARRIGFATALASGRLPLTKKPDLDYSEGMGKRQLERQLERQSDGRQGNMAAPDSPPLDAASLLNTLGPGIVPATRNTIAANPPAIRAAMVLGSPDFMQH